MDGTNTSSVEKTLIALPWIFVPLLAIHFASLWNQLPQRIATHFDARGNPNGWQSPSTFAMFSFVLLLFTLVVLNFAMVRTFRARSMARTLTLVSYLVIGTSFTMLWQTLDHAAYGRPMSQVWPIPLVFPLMLLLLALVLCAQLPQLSTRPSADAALIAEEQHRSLFQLLFAAPGVFIGFWLATHALGVPRFLGIFLMVLMGWVTIVILDGFRYLVRSDGVQIKGFLLPLRFIPRSSIHSYRMQPWTGLGYGIRLTSSGTAYIWGGRNVVNIVTDSGDVMLGHDHPERLIHDLDQMMQTPGLHETNRDISGPNR